MSQTFLEKNEEQAMMAVRREMDSSASSQLFREIWWFERKKGDLKTFYAEEFLKKAAVRGEAVDVMERAAARARIGWNAREAMEGGGEGSAAWLIEARRPRRNEDEDTSPSLEASTVIRTEAVSLLIAELAGDRGDVQQYRRDHLAGLLDGDQVDDYLDGLDYNQANELLQIALEVRDTYGVGLGPAFDLVLAGRTPELRPIHVGPPPTGSTVCQMQFAFAPWASPEDAAAALRGAQLRASKLREFREHKARAAERKREAIKRYEAGETPEAKGRRPWLSDPQYTPPPRRPEFDTSGGRVRGLHDDSVRVFLFVSRQRRETEERQTWEALMKGFNALQEEDARHYTKAESFAKTYRRARATLLTWLPEPLAGLPEPRPRLILDDPEEGSPERMAAMRQQ